MGLHWTGVWHQGAYLSQSIGRVVALQQRPSTSTRPSGVSDVAVLVHRLGQSHLDRRTIHYLAAQEDEVSKENVASCCKKCRLSWRRAWPFRWESSWRGWRVPVAWNGQRHSLWFSSPAQRCLKQTTHRSQLEPPGWSGRSQDDCWPLCTWPEAVELLLYGLLSGLQHQVPHVQDLDRCHGVLVNLHLRLRPVHGDGVTPQLNTTWREAVNDC